MATLETVFYNQNEQRSVMFALEGLTTKTTLLALHKAAYSHSRGKLPITNWTPRHKSRWGR